MTKETISCRFSIKFDSLKSFAESEKCFYKKLSTFLRRAKRKNEKQRENVKSNYRLIESRKSRNLSRGQKAAKLKLYEKFDMKNL